MAWVKAQDGRLVYAGGFVLTSAGGGAGNNKREIRSGGMICGLYSCQDIAGRVMDAIEGWLMADAPGVFVMPGKDYPCDGDSFIARRARELRRCSECRHDNLAKASACRECCSSDTHSHWEPKTVQDVKLPCKFFGGPLDGTTMCVSNAAKNFSIPIVGDGELVSWEYERIGARTDFILKAFPAHDASKPRTAFCCDAFRRHVQLGVFGGNDNFRDGSWRILREGSKHRMNFCPFCSALLKGSMYAATEYKE